MGWLIIKREYFLGYILKINPFAADMSKLFVYGVNAQCPRETLEDEFSKYGEVVDVYNTGKGFAFVTFADERNASEAIRGMNGQVIDGQEIKVDVASSKGDSGGRGGGRGGGGHSGGNRRLFVSGVNENCPNETLEQEFAKYGEVTDLFITRKGFAFVTMGDDDGTAAAIRELNGAFVNGQEIGVDHARPRGGGRGGGGGFGRGGGGFRGGDDRNGGYRDRSGYSDRYEDRSGGFRGRGRGGGGFRGGRGGGGY